jgi:thiosulfate reductase/polysulfide reductase chain A
MCGMCAVRCPIEVTVEDGRVTWLQGNPHDKAVGTSLCAKGSAGLAFEYDDERPQTPLIRAGPRGGGQWRRASWDEALDYIADKLRETIEVFGRRGIALSDRGGVFNDLTRAFVQALGSPNYFNHDASCGGNVHNAARSLFGFSHSNLIYDLKNAKHLVLYGRNLVESLMVTEAKAFMGAMANGMRCTYIDPPLDKLKLLVSIDVRHSETGWFADVMRPVAERTNVRTKHHRQPRNGAQTKCAASTKNTAARPARASARHGSSFCSRN